MKPPKKFKYRDRVSYSICIACALWKYSCNYFRHEGRLWTLCDVDYADYWENTDELLADYKEYRV